MTYRLKYALSVIISLACISYATAQGVQKNTIENEIELHIPGMLFEETEKATIKEFSTKSPFPSEKYNDIDFNEEEIYQLYEDKKYDEIIYKVLLLARNGSPRAEETLGVMYSQGLGITPDDKKAYKWFSRAAESHRPLAQHYLGVMHFQGKGTYRDYIQAAMYLSLAVENYLDGPEKQRAIDDKENVTVRLSKTEQSRAQELIRSFHLKHPKSSAADVPTDPSQTGQ